MTSCKTRRCRVVHLDSENWQRSSWTLKVALYCCGIDATARPCTQLYRARGVELIQDAIPNLTAHLSVKCFDSANHSPFAAESHSVRHFFVIWWNGSERGPAQEEKSGSEQKDGKERGPRGLDSVRQAYNVFNPCSTSALHDYDNAPAMG